jgi:hypothetical protein
LDKAAAASLQARLTQQQAFNFSSCQFTGKQILNNATAASLKAS